MLRDGDSVPFYFTSAKSAVNHSLARGFHLTIFSTVFSKQKPACICQNPACCSRLNLLPFVSGDQFLLSTISPASPASWSPLFQKAGWGYQQHHPPSAYGEFPEMDWLVPGDCGLFHSQLPSQRLIDRECWLLSHQEAAGDMGLWLMNWID